MRHILDQKIAWSFAPVLFWLAFSAIELVPLFAQPTVINSNQLEPIVMFPGIDESEVRSLHDIEDWDPDDRVLLYLVNRMPTISDYHFSRIKSLGTRTSDGIELLEKQLLQGSLPKIQRYQISGQVIKLARHKIRKRDRERYSIAGYYIVDVRHAKSDLKLRVCTTTIPSAWKTNDPVGQTVGIDALFVYACDFLNESESDKKSELKGTAVFAAPRIRWLPNQPNEWISEGQAWLGKHGVDVGLFDQVRKSTGEPLKPSDMASQFEILAAVSGSTGSPGKAPPIDIIEAHEKALSLCGSRMTVKGHLRRITPVEDVSDQYSQRFGIQKYYELDIFVPIQGRLRVKDVETGKFLVFNNNFPVTVRVASLPPELRNNKRPSIDVEIDCFFFRMWGYYSATSRRNEVVQKSPMLIGFEPVVVKVAETNEIDNIVGMVIAAIVILILIAAGYLYLTNRRRRTSSDDTPDSIDLKFD